jgi:hypothetical protein
MYSTQYNSQSLYETDPWRNAETFRPHAEGSPSHNVGVVAVGGAATVEGSVAVEGAVVDEGAIAGAHCFSRASMSALPYGLDTKPFMPTSRARS